MHPPHTRLIIPHMPEVVRSSFPPSMPDDLWVSHQGPPFYPHQGFYMHLQSHMPATPSYPNHFFSPFFGLSGCQHFSNVLRKGADLKWRVLLSWNALMDTINWLFDLQTIKQAAEAASSANQMLGGTCVMSPNILFLPFSFPIITKNNILSSNALNTPWSSGIDWTWCSKVSVTLSKERKAMKWLFGLANLANK